MKKYLSFSLLCSALLTSACFNSQDVANLEASISDAPTTASTQGPVSTRMAQSTALPEDITRLRGTQRIEANAKIIENTLNIPWAAESKSINYRVSSSPLEVPTFHKVEILDGSDINLVIASDVEMGKSHLFVKQDEISIAANPDGTYSIDETLYPTLSAMTQALVGDQRLAPLTPSHIITWSVAMAEALRQMPTRVPTACEEPIEQTLIPRRYACERWGETSHACRFFETSP